MNKDVLLKVDELIKKIEESDNYQKYLLLREKMNNNKDLMRLIREVKILQKDVSHKIERKEELENKIKELESFPVYREYNNTLMEINNLYAIIEQRINNYFYKKLN